MDRTCVVGVNMHVLSTMLPRTILIELVYINIKYNSVWFRLGQCIYVEHRN